MAPPFLSLPPRRSPVPGSPQSFRATPLEIISDNEGFVSIGWIGTNVLYAQLVGGISADVGAAHAVRIRGFAEETPALHFFIDASRVSHYDLLARSAFVRALLSNRRKFQGITLLTFAQATNPAEAAFVNVLGEPLDLLRDAGDFEARLQAAAPFAQRLVEDGLRFAAADGR